MDFDFRKEIKIPRSFFALILPSIISYFIIIQAYFGGEDGLAVLISWIDPFVFVFVPLIQKFYIKSKDFDIGQKRNLSVYFGVQIIFGIVVLIATYAGKPHWDCLELYMRWLFWASFHNILSGIICLKCLFN